VVSASASTASSSASSSDGAFMAPQLNALTAD
jgi:hypothetical protein